MKIEKALKADHKELTELTKESKAFWGFSQEQIEKWSEELTITEDYLKKNEVYKLTINGKIIGYFSFFEIEKNVAKLDNIFILPEFIGQGYGEVLMNDFLVKVKEKGLKKVRLDSEPKAEGFYQKFGFEVIGKLKSSIKNRYLPIMEKQLSKV